MRTMFIGLLAGIIDIALIPLIMWVSHKAGWYDLPNERKIHTGQIPRLGGVGIFLSFAVAIFILVLTRDDGLSMLSRHWPVAAGMVAIHLVGLLDDFLDLRALARFAAQTAIAVFVVVMGYRFRELWLPGVGVVGLGPLSYPFTILWIVGAVNAVNMIDGMDGLSGGVAIIAAFSMSVVFLDRGAVAPAMVAIALVGSLAGYLFYNFPPARIFMGDSGSTFLGFALAVLPLMDESGAAPGIWAWGAGTVLLVPIFDGLAAIMRRQRRGVSLMSPDKWHLHHKLMRLGLGTRSILAVIYAGCMALGAVTISVIFLPPLFHWLLVVAAWLALLAAFVVLHYVKERSLGREEQAELNAYTDSQTLE